MRPYIAIFVARFKTLIQYRMAALAGLATQWVFGCIMIAVLLAFYDGAAAGQPMTIAQVVTYTWLGQAMLGMLPWNMDAQTAEAVRTGQVAYDLARPIGLYAHWYARAMAQRTAPTLLRCIPMFLIATFLMPTDYRFVWPALPNLLAWLLAICGAAFLSCAITAFMQSTLFWTVSGDGICRILPHIVTLLSGMVIPLPLFPEWLQGFIKYQPFSGLVASPAMLFVGVLPASDVWGIVLLQIFWAAVFVLAGWAILSAGLRRLTLAGG